MHSFKDTQARTWTVRLNVAALKRVKATLGLSLAELADGEETNPLAPLADFVSDPLILCDTLMVVLEPDLKAAGVTPEQFADALDGDVIYDAGQSFVRAYIDFFQPKARKSLMAMIEKGQAMAAKMLERADSLMEGIDIDKEVERLATSLSASSGSAPAS